jgi:RNA recognition motif-containing protein
MKSKIYVGNLSYDVENTELENLFNSYGEVLSVSILKDRYTGKGRGFGFIEMSTKDNANSAIDGLNESSFMGRNLIVNMAKERPRANSQY